jgi:Sap, sulfolipid-1-addressing protein
MGDLWSTLLPLVVASALVPVQITLTVLLLRSSVATAAAWVGGMTATRLVQGVLFGIVFAEAGAAAPEGEAGPGPVVSGVLLVVALLFLTKAVKTVMGGGSGGNGGSGDDDEDAAPPRWMRLTESVTPGRAFLLGAGYVAVAAKLWVFTLGAIGAIDEAGAGGAASVALFLLFVALAEAIPIAAVAYAALAPSSSRAVLESASVWLERNTRIIVIVLGFVFGAWFLLKALQGLGVL